MIQFLHELLETQAATRPEHLAIVWKDERILYGELDRLTNQLAQALRANGTYPGDRVAVLMPNSPNTLIAVLGILKAGCVAVPLDITVSANLLSVILSDVQPAVVLASRSARPVLDELFAVHSLGSNLLSRVSIGTLEALPIEGEFFATAFSGLDVLHHSNKPLACRATTNSPALRFFGNGEPASDVGDHAASPVFEAMPTVPGPRPSTTVSHAEVLAFLKSSRAVSDLHEHDRVAALPLLSALPVAVMFGAFAAGAELHVVPHELLTRPQRLATFVRTHELTDWLTNHGLLAELARNESIKDGDFSSLKRLLWTGEPLPSAMLHDLMTRLPMTQFARVTQHAHSKLAALTVTLESLSEAASDPVSPVVSEAVTVG